MDSKSDQNNIVVIAGGGPAGLTMAYELATGSSVLKPVVCEASDTLGGISRTVCHHGNRIDIGGHRFFSKEKRVTDFWQKIMPMQSAPALDEIMMGAGAAESREPDTDPEKSDRVMLRRRRVSRIYYLRKFFDYPVTLSLRTVRSLGLVRTFKAGFGFLASKLHRRPDDNLENFYINRFGRQLYRMFFEDYTEKVWGRHPSRLGADWGSQRVKGLSLLAVVRDMVMKKLRLKGKGKVETSLIEEFAYPKYGPGQLWELTAEAAVTHGAQIRLDSKVVAVHVNPADRRVEAVTVEHTDGSRERVRCGWFVSSMPLRDLVSAIDGIDVPRR